MAVGYKVFNQNWMSKHDDIVFEIGKTYEIKEKPILCKKGFHFCTNIEDCFNYYDNNINNKIAKVEALGDITESEANCSKIATNKIKLLKELTFEEAYILGNIGKCNTGFSNTGNWNTGDRNTGDSNTGDRNTGDSNTGDRNTGDSNTGDRNTGNWNTGNSNTGNRNTGDSNTGDSNTGDSNTGNWNTGNSNTGNSNTGDRNTGYRNTGNWNTCNYETGFFNIKQDNYIRIFDKKVKRSDWEKAHKPNFIYFDLTKWISEREMTVHEKNNYPEYKFLGGYLKKYDYKEAFINSFNSASKSDLKLLLNLPNFNYKTFEVISSITKKMIQEKLK